MKIRHNFSTFFCSIFVQNYYKIRCTQCKLSLQLVYARSTHMVNQFLFRVHHKCVVVNQCNLELLHYVWDTYHYSPNNSMFI